MLNQLKLLFSFLNKDQKRRLFWLLGFMVLVSFFEIASIVLLIDFVNFLGFENKDQYNGILEKILSVTGLNIVNLNIQFRG